MIDPSPSFVQLLHDDRRYKFEAYAFVFEALRFAQTTLNMGQAAESEPLPCGQEDEDKAPERHVSGQELCEAVRQYALDQYGYMAQTVLANFGIRCTGDIGEIVFNLIRIGRMRKTRQDRREDFNDVFDFETAFRREFKIARPERKR